MKAGAEYPGFGLRDPFPDWSNAMSFNMDVYLPTKQTVELHIRIHDETHNEDYFDRFNMTVTLRPGLNQIQIPIQDIKSGPENREIDLTKIAGIYLFVIEPAEDVTIMLDNWQLISRK